MANTATIRVPLLTAQAAAQASLPVDVRSYNYITIYVTDNGVTSSGAISVEEADYEPNGPIASGAWSLVGTAVNASTFTSGGQAAIHLPVGAYSFVRLRISTVIGGGGTITAYLRAN